MNKQKDFYMNCHRCYFQRTGYIKTFSDEKGNTYSVGFTKISPLNLWRAIEISTGLMCSKKDHETLKACVADVESSLYRFEECTKTQLSLEPVLRFRNFVDIKKQFANKKNTSAYGELQAYVELPRFNTLKVTHETDGLEEDDYTYFWEVFDYDGKILNTFYTKDLSDETCFDQLEEIYNFIAKHKRSKK